ncbi:MAG: type IX secretion system membrane protein PorP/SprF [Flavobacteriaceae bacterium]|nr:type IX secretion system membrane protein PorP/SprF [Flavobacteriaceae bacterium]
MSCLVFSWYANGKCAGLDTKVVVCKKDNNAGNQTYDLFAQLGGVPVAGGTCEDPDARGELQFAGGHIVIINNLKHLGGGSYRFKYSLLPIPICSEKSTEISIVIQSSFDGSLQIEDGCVGEDLLLQFSYNPVLMANGVYALGLEIRSYALLVQEHTLEVHFSIGAGSIAIASDLYCNLKWKNLLEFGLSYRCIDAMGALVRLLVGKNISLGYAYDYGVSALSYGSHEMFVRFDWRTGDKKIQYDKSPRFY